MIELLVVLTIVVILASIGLPAFLSQRAKAHDTDAKATTRTAVGAIEVYYQDHDSSYVGVTTAALEAIEPALASARNLVVTGTADEFTISVDSASGDAGGGPFEVKRTNGSTERTCAVPGHGSCPQSGKW